MLNSSSLEAKLVPITVSFSVPIKAMNLWGLEPRVWRSEQQQQEISNNSKHNNSHSSTHRPFGLTAMASTGDPSLSLSRWSSAAYSPEAGSGATTSTEY